MCRHSTEGSLQTGVLGTMESYSNPVIIIVIIIIEKINISHDEISRKTEHQTETSTAKKQFNPKPNSGKS